MAPDLRDIRFVAKALPAAGVRPHELDTKPMQVHPLTYMELDYDPGYTWYNNRLTPSALSRATA